MGLHRAGGGGALLILIIVGLLVSRGGAAPTGNFRVPSRVDVARSARVPFEKDPVHRGYGNCIFSSKQIDPARRRRRHPVGVLAQRADLQPLLFRPPDRSQQVGRVWQSCGSTAPSAPRSSTTGVAERPDQIAFE